MELAVSRLIFCDISGLGYTNKIRKSGQKSDRRLLVSYKFSAVSIQLWNRKGLVGSDKSILSNSRLSPQHSQLSTVRLQCDGVALSRVDQLIRVIARPEAAMAMAATNIQV